MTTPAAAPVERVRQLMPGVDKTPTVHTSRPCDIAPAANAHCNNPAERRVSVPITKWDDDGICLAAAAPNAVAISTVSSTFARPRTPSVPKSAAIGLYLILTNGYCDIHNRLTSKTTSNPIW